MAIYNETLTGGVNVKDCTATRADILSGKTAGVGKEIITGTMPNNGSVSNSIANGKLKQGYTQGGTIPNLTSGNIKYGVNIGGIVGTSVTLPQCFLVPVQHPKYPDEGNWGDTCVALGDNIVTGTTQSSYLYTVTPDFQVVVNDNHPIKYIAKRNNEGSAIVWNDSTSDIACTYDGGITWHNANGLPNYQSITNHNYVLSNGQFAILRTNKNACYQSTDGINWTTLDKSLFPECGNIYDNCWYTSQYDQSTYKLRIFRQFSSLTAPKEEVCQVRIGSLSRDESVCLHDFYIYGNRIDAVVRSVRSGDSTYEVYHSDDNGANFIERGMSITNGEQYKLAIYNNIAYFLYGQSIMKCQNGINIFKELPPSLEVNSLTADKKGLVVGHKQFLTYIRW